MINSIIGFAVLRWQLTLVAFALLAALGAQAFLSIPRSVDPHFPIPVIVVVAIQPGADPEDLEQTVAKPIEQVLYGLDNITKVASSSSNGQAVISAEFSWASDPERDYDQAVREVNAIRAQLPAGLARLEFRKVRTTESAVVQYALVSPDASWRRMEKVAKDLKERFQRVDGVRTATVWGLPKPEVEVVVDLGRLAEYALPVSAVTDALRLGGSDLPAGSVRVGEARFNVKAGGAFRTLAEVKAVPVRAEGGRLVRVGDVADVRWGTEERPHITRLNGERAVWVTATQKDNVNVLDVRNGLVASADEYRSILPPDMKLVLGFDQSDDISRKLAQLGRDFAIALAIVLVTLLPLGPRASLVVMMSVPLSLAIGVLVVNLIGYTLNQLVIAGFILALGLLVDDSIVVVENIARHLRMGMTRVQAALAGTRQIAVAVIGCTAVLVFAFLPLAFLPEGAGKFTRGLPVSVIATVVASMFVALTIIPFLASRLLPKNEPEHGNRFLQVVQGGIHRFYQPVLHWALEKPKIALAAAMALCILALGLIPVLGSSLFPPADTPYFLVEVQAPEEAEKNQTARAVAYVEEVLKGEPEVVNRLANVGRGNPQVFYNVREIAQKSNYGAVLAVLDEWRPATGPALLARVRAKFSAYPDARITVSLFQNGAPIDAPIVWYINGPQLDVIKALSRKVEGAMKSVAGVRDVRNPLAFDRVDVALGLDADRAALLGVAPAAARRVTRLALAGEAAGRFRDDEGDSYDVMVRLAPADPAAMGAYQTLDALQRVFVPSINGAAVPLLQVATPQLVSGPPSINRYLQQRSVAVTANVEQGFVTGKVGSDVAAKVRALPLPAGYSVSIGGEAEARSRSFSGLGGIIMLTVFGILGILVLEFGRFRETLVVVGVIPLGMFGGLIALWANGMSISYTAIIGFVALIGIEIKNSILLVDFTGQLRAQGMELREAIERAGEVRFLPVLLTSVTAIGGLLPLAVSGSGLYGPLAWVIIGGLVSSTLLSRVVTPVMYLLLVRKAPPVTAEAGAEATP
ncbi:efflux RND transporter permease subunit [Sandaracinobacteroides saxicola]|uniref:Efflux RND transporter permease subunit n=1 Tax=Sandaracinobacteroides saxicola TaxID=2759707 RepID=A0A7G5IJX6_9SPHN|nr:efflux RND transporter permease subunit [Sandaracinobacteroides saxicola]QMW23668.1 efflux RND transporter permease subunit [Sandaracinobacteroides saxicola]